MITLTRQGVELKKYLHVAAIAIGVIILWDLFYNYGRLTIEFLFLVTGDV